VSRGRGATGAGSGAGESVIGEIELAAQFCRADCAITGSNGKTTTTTLTGEILSAGGLPTLVGETWHASDFAGRESEARKRDRP